MKLIKTEIPEVVIIEPKIFSDDRGYFCETYRDDILENFLGFKIWFCQDNESKSQKGVLRGLHYQLPPFAQSKLVRVIKGRVLDVAVDIRLNSPTFGRYIQVELSEYNKKQLFIPRGFVHGFITLEDDTIFSYKVDNYYSKTHDRGILYNDKDIGIDWFLNDEEIILSEKDIVQPNLYNNQDLFYYGVNYYA
ncbi:TPA: dTDP-4-dehydrorhamnose 3,5-epimerase [Campylobacter lari]|uniref:dTDP-4-dehydrorhamnose 3,5-epimerase n=1 Tax=Campylobacter sp. FU_497 TaxID=2911610 RepID=UPI0021E68C57|nr:dTDP-4-dehydrorhamnose 3,5-epimerase [Campylobacter sp. FU_497]MCV3462699.1 dTDP-4-dehydrorhamnose 3,5-epimerase [Campylobacter sp. FU_497]HEC1758833.1 dTDP-4-dehydrorhamnose 3,5-epimerase [Campylobacter lari]